MSSAGKKALATLGRRGGKTSAAKRWGDKDSELAQKSLEPLERANKQRKSQGSATRGRILTIIASTWSETGSLPSRREVAREVGCSLQTVTWHMSALRKAGMLPE